MKKTVQFRENTFVIADEVLYPLFAMAHDEGIGLEDLVARLLHDALVMHALQSPSRFDERTAEEA